MAKKPGDAFAFQFAVSDSNGALAAADSTPAATAVRNGTDDGAVTIAVTAPSTGIYKAAGRVPVGYASGDDFQVRINATVGGVASAALRDYGTLDGQRVSDLYARVGPPSGVSLSADIAAVTSGVAAAGTALSTANNTLTAHTTALAAANASLATTAGLYATGAVSSVTGPNSFTVAFTEPVSAPDLVNDLCCLTSGTHKYAKATITGATQVDPTHAVLVFNPPFASAPAANVTVQVG